MRYTPEQKEETRRRILEAASRAFRRTGFENVSVAEIMRDAGLTVGGFYRHFKSKEELFDAAMIESMGETLRLMQRRSREREQEPGGRPPESRGAEWMRRAASFYLTPQHRKMTERGCPIPVLSTEIKRRDESLQGRYEDSLEEVVAEIATRIDPEAPEKAHDQAWGFLSTLVGNLLLARSLSDEDKAADVLAAGRRAAAALHGPDEDHSG